MPQLWLTESKQYALNETKWRSAIYNVALCSTNMSQLGGTNEETKVVIGTFGQIKKSLVLVAPPRKPPRGTRALILIRQCMRCVRQKYTETVLRLTPNGQTEWNGPLVTSRIDGARHSNRSVCQSAFRYGVSVSQPSANLLCYSRCCVVAFDVIGVPVL